MVCVTKSAVDRGKKNPTKYLDIAFTSLIIYDIMAVIQVSVHLSGLVRCKAYEGLPAKPS